eukprot:gene15815-21933_t
MAATAAQNAQIDDLMPSDEDLLYEEELLRNPYSLKMWLRYISARSDAAPKKRYLLYERALKVLPGSYKLWYAYLKERSLAVRGQRPDSPGVESLNNTYERALVSMHKMPRIWMDYLELLLKQQYITRTRRTFDRALTSLPITQHDKIWLMYLANWGEAAKKLADILNDEMFRSLEGKSKHMLWLELCDIITKHPKDVKDMRVDAILRGGIRKFTDEVGRLWTSLADYYIRRGMFEKARDIYEEGLGSVGRLWTSLADYYIRRGMFEKARDIYEEGLGSVSTVHDFSLIFDALSQFEESLIAAKLEQMTGEEEDKEVEAGSGIGGGEDFPLTDDGGDIDLRLARLEHMMSRRPELLNSVMLRQNPHNVHEWHNRVKLFKGQLTKQILTYTEAVKTIDIEQAVGKPHSLWCAFAKFYEFHGDVVNARVIFDKATQSALQLLRSATKEPPRSKKMDREEERKLPVQDRLYRNLKVWSFYADLEESLGTLETTKGVYDRVMELRIATPQIILNYALFLQEQKYFEDSFRVYERGVALFKYPHVKDIWQTYLQQFVERYGGSKLERARDLFEHALTQAPPEETKPIYLQYALLEEKYGLAKHAMEVYSRAVRIVPKKERMGVYDLYVREIYETAIEAETPYELADEDVRTMSLRYAQLEKKLGEVDRSRAIFIHASGLCDPRRDKSFWNEWKQFEVAHGNEDTFREMLRIQASKPIWNEWKQFEVAHGNEDTFREMLRIQRSVAASFSHTQLQTSIDAANVAEQQGKSSEPASDSKRAYNDTMAALEAEAVAEQEAIDTEAAANAPKALPGFVSAGIIQQGDKTKEAAAEAAKQEIDLDMDAEDEEGGGEEEENVELEQKAVPSAVFGSLAPPSNDSADGADAKRRKVGE